MDAVFQNLAIAKRKVDIKERLRSILDGLESVYTEFYLPIVYPIHPRTTKRIAEFRLKIPVGVDLIEPQGFLEFLELEANAKLVLTDSGGVQEETSILKVPCVTLRDNTERPETIEVGSNVLAGVNRTIILDGVKSQLSKERNWENPFGDGKAGSKIVKILMQHQALD